MSWVTNPLAEIALSLYASVGPKFLWKSLTYKNWSHTQPIWTKKIPVAPVFGPLGPETVKSRIGIKKLNLLRFAAYGFVDFFSLKAKQKSQPNPNKGKQAKHTHDKGAFHPSKAPSNSMKISSKNI